MSGSFITDDLSALLNSADFADSVVWAQGNKNIDGVFDDDEIEVDTGNGNTHLQRIARIVTKTSHAVADGDHITHDGTRYKVEWQQDDGTGMVTLYLQKAPL